MSDPICPTCKKPITNEDAVMHHNCIKPDGNIHAIPKKGKEHIESINCWCGPRLSYVDSVTKIEVFIHKSPEEMNN